MKKSSIIATAFCALVSTTSFAQTLGDINYMSGYSFSHDSTSCSTTIIPNNFLLISNSFVGDTVKIIDFGGQMFYVEVNNSGNADWTVSLPAPGPVVEGDIAIENGMLFIPLDVQMMVYKIISGPDTLHVDPVLFFEQIDHACSYGEVTGQVYLDNNSDCVFNATDSAIQSVWVHSLGNFSSMPVDGSASGTTNASGNYTNRVQESWLTDYTVQIPSMYQFIFPNSNCTPLSYNFTTLPQSGVDFVLECADLDTRVDLLIGGQVRPGIPFSLHPRVSNIGCTPVSGTLKLVLDQNVTYNPVSSSNPADIVNGDTLIWNYSGLTNVSNGSYWNYLLGSIELTPDVSVNIGDTLCFAISTQTPSNDVAPSNNQNSYCFPVVNSFDPNMKEAAPKGTGPEGYIPASTEKLTYTVHFQNTGSASAINIRVVDSLQENVIPSSLRIIASSHTMTPEWLSSDVISFRFNSIMLPDSSSNEPESHGFVQFEIDMAQGLDPGTQIKNRADIYFDSNEPVTTDYALNTIAQPDGIGHPEMGAMAEMRVYPNPMDDEVHFRQSRDDGAMHRYLIRITDLTGKAVLTKDIVSNGEFSLERGNLKSGFYLFTVNDLHLGQVSSGKLAVR